MSSADTVPDWDAARLLEQFESCELRPAQFRHRQHVQVAWAVLSRSPILEALQRFRRGLKTFAHRNNVPALYNETITCFYLLLIRERMDRLPATHTWREFAASNADLFAHPKSFLQAWYPEDAAFSDEAKAAFILPASP